jgi:hypothetical protein
MTIPDLIKLLEARTVDLTQQRATLAGLGDVAGILRLETELLETEITLAALRAAIGV